MIQDTDSSADPEDPRGRTGPGGLRPAYRWALLAAVGVVLLASLIYLLVLALGGEKLYKLAAPRTGHLIVVHNVTAWLVVATVAAIAGLAGWALGEHRLSSLTGAVESEGEAREAEREVRKRLKDSERERERLESTRGEERAQRERLVRAWQSEREWNRELRGQVARMQASQGVLGRHDDVREMILKLTMGLVEADKGILLSAREKPHEGREVVCALGFDNDPQESAIAQRFATEVIERDTMIREDDAGDLDAERRGAADEEVRNLLAIPMYLADDFVGVIVCANREGGFASVDDEVLLAVGDHAGAVLHNSRLHGDLRSAYLSTIRVLAHAIELKDAELRWHSDAVSEYVTAVADRLELEPERREALIFASLLHDVGKLGISERILLKPARLTDEERSVIELHPRIGARLVSQVPALQGLAPAVLHHHERFDGDGYPGRLSGETIPLEARIIAIADSFSAMTSHRPYSPPRDPEDACAELERCAGEQFDPELVRLFVEEVRRRGPDELAAPRTPEEPEFELHRADGELVLGGRAFGITDSLTLLYSHRHFHETARAQAQRAAVQGRPFAVLVAALVDLWEINREHGFAEGDSVLRAVAAVFQSTAARADGLAFRASGRRLALIAPGLDQEGAERLATALRAELDGTPKLEIGVAAWRPGEDGEQVITRAQHGASGVAPVVP
ncbi:MAG: HD domain-containing phosphohydrolase [Solirubrobacteraceae bacterium]